MAKPEIIAAISCTHFPYHHQDTIPFLRGLNDVFKPTLWVHLGDEGDSHAMNYHEHDPDLDSAGKELKSLRYYISELKEFVPKMYLMESNHGSMVYRKAKTAGIPREALKSYNDYLKAPSGWMWMPKLELDVGTQNKRILFQHGHGSAIKTSRAQSLCVVQGHLHTEFYIQHWGAASSLKFGMQVGCLIDNKSLAYAYNKVNVLSPILGAGIIIDGNPILVPMRLNDKGRWTGDL